MTGWCPAHNGAMTEPAQLSAADDVRTFEAIAELVADGDVTVLSGAGISTESGIPAYRGPDGRRHGTPMTAADLLRDTEARRRYWARAYAGWPGFRSARPNSGHRAVARLQARGLVGTVITQNVDGLHQQAGADPVLELHGTLSRVRCMNCDERFDREVVDEWLRVANPQFDRHREGIVKPDGDIDLDPREVAGFRLVHCIICGSDLLKPDVVMFGESVPKALVTECFDRVEASRLLLVLGSSLAVMSGYRFVRRAHALQIPVASITTGWTRGDDETTYKLQTPLGTTLTDLVAAVA